MKRDAPVRIRDNDCRRLSPVRFSCKSYDRARGRHNDKSLVPTNGENAIPVCDHQKRTRQTRRVRHCSDLTGPLGIRSHSCGESAAESRNPLEGTPWAISTWLTVERQAADVPVDCKEGTVGGENSAAAGEESQTHQRGTAEDVLGMALRRDTHDSTAAAKGSND